MSKSSDLCSVVKSYLEKTNRPFSANDVTTNLSTRDNKVSKTLVIRALEELAANQLIKEKVNGKQKIYLADQNNFNVDENRVQQINEELDRLNTDFEQIKNQIKPKESKLSALKSGLTSQQLDQKLSQLRKEVFDLEERLKTIESSAQDFDPMANKKVKNERQLLVKEWRKRKRMAVDILDKIVEGYPKPKKALLEEIGVETDEDIGALLPQI